MNVRLLFVFVCLLVVGSPCVALAESKAVSAVEIEGNKKIESAAISIKIKTAVQSTLSKDLIREDIRGIYSLGFFESVDVYEEAYKTGIKVTFVVHEKPTVTKIEYKGLDAFEEDDLKDQIQIKRYEVLNLAKVNQTVEKLTAKYEEKGYYLADIHYEIQLEEKRNEATVIFHIEENDKIQVKRINIIGNKVVESEDLKALMQTKEGGPFSWMTGSGAYRESLFERDLSNLGYYYGTLGYVRARFGKPEVSVSADKKAVYITFFVEEGEKYFVGKVDFTGDLLFNRQELLDDLKLVQGETFNTEVLRRETLKYTEKYSDLGYAFANVVPQPNIHDDTKTVDVNFEVERGERIYIGQITVTGNTRTKDKVIRRELKIREGELFSGTKKRESRENVVRLGFFDNVDFHQSTAKEASNVVDIEIKVKERSTGQLVVSAGYASGNFGFTAQAQLAQNNFLGNGQIASLSATMMTGRKYYDFNMSFQEPFVGASLWSLGGDLYQSRRDLYTFSDVPTFEETRTGAKINLGHPVMEFTNLFLSYKYEGSWIPRETIIDNSNIDSRSVNGRLSSLTSSVIFDKRDDRFDPREGHYWSLSEEVAGIGGDKKFLRSRAQFKYFHPIIWDLIFRFNAQGSTIESTGVNDVPVNELFVTGGLFSLRGYNQLSVGPTRRLSSTSSDLSQAARDKNLMGKEFVFGGHNELIFNTEGEFPILKEARLRGVV